MRGVQKTAIENLKNIGISVEERQVKAVKRTNFLLDLCREVAEAIKETVEDYTDDNNLDWGERFAKINDIVDIGKVVARHKEAKDDFLALSKQESYAEDIEQAVKQVFEGEYQIKGLDLKSPKSILLAIVYNLKMVADAKHDIDTIKALRKSEVKKWIL